ncbi:MAG: S8 family serine peptidase [Candidatus Polarisedimenticolia bacterium]
MARLLARVLALVVLAPLVVLGSMRTSPVLAEPYVTPASFHRWNSAAGIRFNDAGGIRFNDAGGIRFNDVGGIRFNDAGEVFFSEASGIRFNDVGGIRFNDAGGIRFNDAGGEAVVGLPLLDAVPFMADTSSINVIVSYHQPPGTAQLDDLRSLGITGGTIFRRLPMVVVTATRDQIAAVAALPDVRSVWADQQLGWVMNRSRPFIGVAQAEADPFLRGPAGLPYTGQGVTIAFIDTGIDATHPDLPFGTKVIDNVRVEAGTGLPGFFAQPAYTQGIPNTDLILGHGTFAAGVAAGTGAASSGLYRGVAPGAGLVGISVGDLYLVNVLEGFDYVLWQAAPHGIRVVNCSFSTSGPFDPDDPVNIATRALYDAGLTVVFAAGNYGPAPDTLSPYAVAPWVIGVASGDTSGRLSGFSSRGILDEGLYHPTLTAPGERIISTSSVSLQGVFGMAGVPSGSGAAVPDAHLWAYSEASGTSFAAPHVAGVVALMLQADPSLGPAAIKRLLQSTATRMASRNRAEAGAGYLDAWAALTAVKDPSRPFGSFIPEMLDQRRGRRLFGPMVAISGTVPPGGFADLPLPSGTAALSMTASIAWDASADDLDLVVLDAEGNELARSGSINALGIFGTTEGVSLYQPAAAVTLRVSPKLPLAAPRDFAGHHQTMTASFPLIGDLGGLSSMDRALATRALDALAITARPCPHRSSLRSRDPGDDGVATPAECFSGASPLLRVEAARLLAVAAQLPQTLPPAPTFGDVPAGHPAYLYVESVAGPRARRGVVMPASGPSSFSPGGTVQRIELAVRAVEALGLGSEAAAWSGALDVTDAADLPPGTEGHAAIALSLGILTTTPTASGEALRPGQAITRLEAARAAVAMLDQAR